MRPRPRPGRRLIAAALGLPLVACAAAPPPNRLEAVTPDGRLVGAVTVPRGSGWCLDWNHSVTGDPVADCYLNDGGRMVLSHAFQPDFAAGLGHFPGRGVFRPGRGDGYLIDAIDEPVPGNAYRLRVGAPAVDHRIITDDGQRLPLSARVAGQPVILRLVPAPSSQDLP
ncbi:DUF1850 domain-containing protein [Roseospirillum parvum]|uniref:DUF1850 domain-containing protein n=1 Tax=Roseospirillum parvum TaxID=83401 RepID=A0A1G8CUC2_9PROT|nr:DUF1850 domain-containing protein [Roseospirillum parvum]SDH48864.1 hypothetical protein SAMN05421742_10797 [Roseospirillum parvum]